MGFHRPPAPTLTDAIAVGSMDQVLAALDRSRRDHRRAAVSLSHLDAAARRNDPAIVRCLHLHLPVDVFNNHLAHAARQNHLHIVRAFGPLMTPLDRGNLLEELFAMRLYAPARSKMVALLLDQGVAPHQYADALETAVRGRYAADAARLLPHCRPDDVDVLFRTLVSPQPEAIPSLSQAHPQEADLLAAHVGVEVLRSVPPETLAAMPVARRRLEAVSLETEMPASSAASRCRL